MPMHRTPRHRLPQLGGQGRTALLDAADARPDAVEAFPAAIYLGSVQRPSRLLVSDVAHSEDDTAVVGVRWAS